MMLPPWEEPLLSLSLRLVPGPAVEEADRRTQQLKELAALLGWAVLDGRRVEERVATRRWRTL